MLLGTIRLFLTPRVEDVRLCSWLFSWQIGSRDTECPSKDYIVCKNKTFFKKLLLCVTWGQAISFVKVFCRNNRPEFSKGKTEASGALVPAREWFQMSLLHYSFVHQTYLLPLLCFNEQRFEYYEGNSFLSKLSCNALYIWWFSAR